MEHPFLREEMALGERALHLLARSHVAVFGIGGVGSYVVEGLARAGVGALTLVDDDTVGITNLNRQLCALHSTLGRPKAQVMGERVLDINPQCQVRTIVARYTEANKERFLDRPYDYIVDAIDLVSCKLSLIENAHRLEIPIISALGTGNKLDPTLLRVSDISKTEGCPLARIVRKELRARGIAHHKVVWSSEPAHDALQMEAPPPGRHSVPASVMWVPASAGLLMAAECVKDLTAE